MKLPEPKLGNDFANVIDVMTQDGEMLRNRVEEELL